jgi:outer membrane autotransporter protein
VWKKQFVAGKIELSSGRTHPLYRRRAWPILGAEIFALLAGACFSRALTFAENVAVGTYSSTIPLYYADMQTLVEREGEVRLGLEPTGGGPGSSRENPWEAWIRGFGGGLKIDNEASGKFDQDYGGFQTGIDRNLGQLWGGNLYLGGFSGYIHASRDFHDQSVSRTDVFSLGTYTTWLHPSGWYLDLVGKYSQMSTSFTARASGGAASNGDYGIATFGGSIEFGKRVELASHRFFIEPQVQLAGAWENGMDYRTSDGLRVQGEQQNSLQGGLGGRIGMHFDFSRGRAIEPYVKGEVIEEFLADNRIRTGTDNSRSQLSGATAWAGAGVTLKAGRAVYLYSEYDYATGDHLELTWAMNVGFRLKW